MRPLFNLHVLLSLRSTRVVAQLLFMDHALQTNHAIVVCATTPFMSTLVVPPFYLCVVYTTFNDVKFIQHLAMFQFISAFIEFQ